MKRIFLIIIFLISLSLSFAQNNITIYGGINYGLHTGVRDYINKFNFDNNKFMPSVSLILEKCFNLSEKYNIGFEAYYNYLALTKSNPVISNFQLDINTLGLNLTVKQQLKDNIFIGGGLGFNHNIVKQSYLSESNSKGSLGLLLLTDLVATPDDDNSFSLVISPRIRINLPGNLNMNINFPLLANKTSINLNSFTTELNIGIKF